MKILVATDAWGQTNGVVFAYQRIAAPVREFGAELAFVTPEGFPSLPLPTYPGIRLALASAQEVGRRIDRIAPTHVHIATEGPVGWAARRYCLTRGLTFTTNMSPPGCRCRWRGAIRSCASSTRPPTALWCRPAR